MLADAPFLAACRGLPVERVPVWFMRQAGRSLPEYRAIRGEGSILDAIRHPELSAEITLQPVRRYGVDAAILYSDIVVPVAGVGFGIDIAPGVGPVVERPFASEADLVRLRPLDPDEDVPYVQEAIRIVVGELRGLPLIGFAGAPFTLASYLIEGRPSRSYARTKAMMMGEPSLWRRLLDRLADLAMTSLEAQVRAGASAVQLFDSWAGALSPQQYRDYVLPASAKVLAAVAELGVPSIHFGVGTGEILDQMAQAGPDVVGVDWRVPLSEARRRVGAKALQGNLDPAVCLAPWQVVAEEARRVLRSNGGRAGHIFNLGHGVLPETDPSVLEAVVALVHEEGAAIGAACRAAGVAPGTGSADGEPGEPGEAGEAGEAGEPGEAAREASSGEGSPGEARGEASSGG